jgi:hypothetical protein
LKHEKYLNNVYKFNFYLPEKKPCEDQSVNADYDGTSRCLLGDSQEQHKQGVWAKCSLFSVNAEDDGA